MARNVTVTDGPTYDTPPDFVVVERGGLEVKVTREEASRDGLKIVRDATTRQGSTRTTRGPVDQTQTDTAESVAPSAEGKARTPASASNK